MNRKIDYIILSITVCCIGLFASCTKNEDTPPPSTHSAYVSKVYDFSPAPGQYVNALPEYVLGDSKEDMIAKTENILVGKSNAGLISLGGFGGYITVGFDHTIENVKGKRDFRVLGNAFLANFNPNPNPPGEGGSCEPGIIMVAYDANKNGMPDDNEWYEIAGSEYHKPTTTKNYEITYFRPTSEEIPQKDYIKWEDNQGKSGYKMKSTFHEQSYFPSWISDNKITFKGTLLPDNAVNEGSVEQPYWLSYTYEFGYADNGLNTEDNSAIDISWAVDANGNKVELEGIDFIKIYSGVNQEAGVLGEISTEITSIHDLHILGESINSIAE